MFHKRSLRGKCVLITGAAGGIGSELTRQLVSNEGIRLLLVDKDLPGLQRLASDLQPRLPPDRVEVCQVDLASENKIQQFFGQIRSYEIDVLINNAGVAYSGDFAGMNLRDFEELININLYAAVRLSHLLLPKLIQRQGSIVNVASAAGLLSPGGMNAYATSKFALVGFTESLRSELRGRVGVSAVCPCFVRTPIAKSTLLPDTLSAAEKEEQRRRIDQLVFRFGLSTERVARSIVKAIEHNRGVIVPGLRTRVLLMVKRVTPQLADFLNHLVFRRLVSAGCVSEQDRRAFSQSEQNDLDVNSQANGR